MLIENGAPVNAAGDMGETPLHVAVSNKNMTVIDALIKRGARTDIVNDFGKTALDRAVEKGIKISETLQTSSGKNW
jgi:ankyrin repeat protein